MTLPLQPPVGPCMNHPGNPATATCSHCRRPYCSQCLVELLGQQFCGTCKAERVLRAEIGGNVYMPEPVSSVPREHWWALVSVGLAVSSIHPCAGIASGPLAIITGIVAMVQSGRDPTLPRKNVGLVGMLLGLLGTLWSWGGLLMVVLGHK